MTKNQIQGIFPAVLTPYAQNGSVDLNRFSSHVDNLYATGINGIIVNGNAGEWFSLGLEEREELALTAVELSRGRGNAIVHIGRVQLRDSIRLARHASKVGADAISSLPPCVNRWAPVGLRRYFECLSSETRSHWALLTSLLQPRRI
jgi:dihydrodipicolinate synthase/N-acetylneuraminate lyase